MQVKKFEAKTMKEALELVKVHMGPEAIILSARDTHRGFGLMGDKSVEVTAAVSEETLRKKKIAEARMKEELRERFNQIPAAKQKQFINKVAQSQVEQRQRELVAAAAAAPMPQETRAQLKGLRYIDIEDDSLEQARPAADARVRRAAEMARMASREIIPEPSALPKRSPRVKAAAQAAAKAAQATLVPQSVVNEARQAQAITSPAAPPSINPDVQALESQVKELKALVERFQKMPQIPLSMHPGADLGIPYELSGIYQRLTGQGVQSSTVTTLLKRAQKEMDPESIKRPAMVDAWVVRQLLQSIETSKNPLQGKYHVFMGSSGQGKTTSLVKFASHLVLKEKKRIAIISLDTVKVGAADQLRIFAQILNVPFAIVRRPEEWQVAEQKLAQVHHILVDCPGFNLRSMEEADWLKKMIPPESFDRKIHYVQSILARDEETIDIAGRYQMVGFNDVIFSRIDESSRQGLILNFQDRFHVPVHSFGTGPRVPEDYEFATKERIVDFLFKLTKLVKREGFHEQQP